MLYPAIQYKKSLSDIMGKLIEDPKYQYCRYTPKFEQAPDHIVELVSVYKNEILGFITYSTSDIIPNVILGFTVMSFTDKAFLFGKDLYKLLYKLLLIENNHRVEFKVIIGNPIELTYQKLCNTIFEPGPKLSAKANRYILSREKLKQYLKKDDNKIGLS